MRRTYKSAFFSHEMDGTREGTPPYTRLRTLPLPPRVRTTMTLRVRERANDPQLDFLFLGNFSGGNQNLRLSTITNPSKDNDGNDIQSYTVATNRVDSLFRPWFSPDVAMGNYFIDMRPLVRAETRASRAVYGIEIETDYIPASPTPAIDIGEVRGYTIIFELDRAFSLRENPWKPHWDDANHLKLGGGWSKTSVAFGRVDGSKAVYRAKFNKLTGVNVNNLIDLKQRDTFYFSMFGSQGAVLSDTFTSSFPHPRISRGSGAADIYEGSYYRDPMPLWHGGLPEDENQDIHFDFREI